MNCAPVRYSGDQVYFQESLLLWTTQQNNSITIGPGSFSFWFEFVVPFHVLSSFFYKNILDCISSAYISYEVEGHAVTGQSYIDHQDSVKINITSLANISDGNWTTPVSIVKQKQVGCLCYATGSVEFVAKLPRTAYCVANHDIISLTVDVQNNSARVIKIRTKILQKVTMFGQHESRLTLQKNYCKSLAEIYSEPIQPDDSYKWTTINWTVPKLPPTLLGCRVVHVEYILEVSAVIPNALNICNIPPFMGNLPHSMSSEGVGCALPDAVKVQGRSSANIYCNDVDGETLDDYNISERDTLIN